MYTINVIGAGTAGCFTVMYLAKNFPDKEIYWSFNDLDNNIRVGEATVPYVVEFFPETSWKYIIDGLDNGYKINLTKNFKNILTGKKFN